MGCFAAHDHPGRPTEFWLGVHGMCPDLPITVACHDLGLYEALWSGAMCILCIWLNKKPRFPGFYMGLICAVYGPTRLMMDVFRHPNIDTRYWIFTPAQYGSMLLFLIGVTVLYRNHKKTPVRLLTQQSDPNVTQSTPEESA